MLLFSTGKQSWKKNQNRYSKFDTSKSMSFQEHNSNKINIEILLYLSHCIQKFVHQIFIRQYPNKMHHCVVHSSNSSLQCFLTYNTIQFSTLVKKGGTKVKLWFFDFLASAGPFSLKLAQFNQNIDFQTFVLININLLLMVFFSQVTKKYPIRYIKWHFKYPNNTA